MAQPTRLAEVRLRDALRSTVFCRFHAASGILLGGREARSRSA
jgi:hypothetical protein